MRDAFEYPRKVLRVIKAELVRYLRDLSKREFYEIKIQIKNFDNSFLRCYNMYTVRPWLVRWEQAITRCLLNEEERGVYYARFNVDGLLRGDYQSRMEGYGIGRQNGWLSANDIRELEDLSPIPEEQGGNEYFVNSGMMGQSITKAKK